jgi:hypothetical protein
VRTVKKTDAHHATRTRALLVIARDARRRGLRRRVTPGSTQELLLVSARASRRGPQDRDRINFSGDYELSYWTKKNSPSAATSSNQPSDAGTGEDVREHMGKEADDVQQFITALKRFA